jgi:hypothetical protein
LVIWGQDPKPMPISVQNTVNVDQGVVFGGKLTAFHYPQRKITSVPARQDYAQVVDNPLMRWEESRLSPLILDCNQK